MAERAERRHHKDRAYNKARRCFPWLSDEELKKLADNMAVCSCFLCRDARRYLVRARRRGHEADLRDQIADALGLMRP